MVSEQRIGIIDGFRAIAVISVVMFHYYFRFGDAEGMYGYDPVGFFAYGFYGVQLFFIISGFVIYRSLEQSQFAASFIIKRYFRLLPAMLICSIITFVVCNYADPHRFFYSPSPLNFLFTFTFISPDVWRVIFNNPDINYIDGAYWSLWAEVVFYASACAVYFSIGDKKFFRTWLVLVLVLQLGRIATSPRLEAYTPDFLVGAASFYYKSFLFLNINQWMYFTAGIVFYRVWSGRQLQPVEWGIAIALLVLELYFIQDNILRLLFAVLMLLWIAFLKRPQWLTFLNWRPIALTGLISYPLYLLHQNIGLIAIAGLSGWDFLPPLLEPVFVLVIIILLSYFVFAWIEKPVTKFVKSKLLRSQKITDVNQHEAHS